jgi:hypothetical protein
MFYPSVSIKLCHMPPYILENIQGENVPAPFMTFEATGFPPEILREVCFS